VAGGVPICTMVTPKAPASGFRVFNGLGWIFFPPFLN
jgi:hypothetical protein